jgi:hypothetical protein
MSFSFRRLPTTPARKPRTECFCQPVVSIIPASVAPMGARSIATTRDCLESGGALAVLALPAAFVAGVVGLDGADTALETADFLLAAGIGILQRSGLRRRCAAPPKPQLGAKASGAGFQSAPGDRSWRQYRSNGDKMPVVSEEQCCSVGLRNVAQIHERAESCAETACFIPP